MIKNIEKNSTITTENSLNLIPRIDGLSLTPKMFFENYQKQGQPVIITGLLQDEPDWNLDYLCHHIGEEIFPVRLYSQDKNFKNGIGSGVTSQNMSLNKYAQLLRQSDINNQPIYLGKCSLKNTSLALSSVFNNAEKQLGLKQAVSSFNLWLGKGGHTTHLHYDPLDGTLMQLSGEKEIILFPPSQLDNLYPLPILNHFFFGQKVRCNHSQVSLKEPDFSKFPKLKKALAHQYNIILHQGEILYIPAGWWHEVKLLGNQPVCSVNRWWFVSPLFRSITCWSQWRVHLGTLLATPHILGEGLSIFFQERSPEKLKQLIQKI
jgi:lysine-specific demethylase 8/hypoxia-inducible factor 1-alpha inhibitor (HIF hydroxylase)